ncbi:hypothetical protein A5gp_00013 [Alteromonas phage vB_AemP_PT15-A5]|nr:hypothetical protein A5gp_00013 [Alteromonas phage vB_AemP_PT15-A5]
MIERLKKSFNWVTHNNLREIATTLNFFNLIEIGVVVWVLVELHRLLNWYMENMTMEHFNGVAFWGAIAGAITGLLGALKFMHDTLKERRKMQ